MELDFDKENGLLPAIVQAAADGAVLMVGYMNREAYARTLATGYVTFWSRSRCKLWTKGETSGNRLRWLSLHADCDGDALLLRVEMEGLQAACHTGHRSCFFSQWQDGGYRETGERVFQPEDVYGRQ